MASNSRELFFTHVKFDEGQATLLHPVIMPSGCWDRRERNGGGTQVLSFLRLEVTDISCVHSPLAGTAKETGKRREVHGYLVNTNYFYHNVSLCH